jgi:hypothetical protein
VNIDSAVVVLAATDWDKAAVELVAPPLEEAGPLSSSLSAVSGRFLIFGNRKAFIETLLARISDPAATPGARYAAFYQHSTALPDFLKMTRLIDNPLTNTGQGDQEPAFFSRNLGSLGQALASIESESISVHDTGSAVTQSVIYRTKK